MIKFNDKNVNDMAYGDLNVPKAYYNGKVAYVKYVSGVTPEPSNQHPCFAVTSDISTYDGYKYDTVYDSKQKKWYMLNNLGEYEVYGVIGQGIDITTYAGKLTVDNGYEYEWDGNGWVEIGSTTLTEYPSYVIFDNGDNGTIDLGIPFSPSMRIQLKHMQTGFGGGAIIGDHSANDNDDFRIFGFSSSTLYFDYINNRGRSNFNKNVIYEWEIGDYYIKNLTDGSYLINQSSVNSSRTNNLYLYGQTHSSGIDSGYIYYVKIYDGEDLIRDFIPWVEDDVVGMKDIISYVFYPSEGDVRRSEETSQFYYIPKEYASIKEPSNNIEFDSMEEALKYECPWVGMTIYVGGVRYRFTEDNTWEELTAYVSVDLNDQWQESTHTQITTSTGDLDPDLYNFYESFSNFHKPSSMASMIIEIDGYDRFEIVVRNDSESNYDFVVVNNLDDLTMRSSWSTAWTVGEGIAKDGLCKWSNKGLSSPTMWHKVLFTNIPAGTHHIMVTYGKDSSSDNDPDKGYVAIPKS